MKSLVELITGKPSAEEILSAFKDYSESGAAISADSVINIVNNARNRLSTCDLGMAYNYMKKGYEIHDNRSKHKKSEEIEANEFLRAMSHIAHVFDDKVAARDKPSIPDVLIQCSIKKSQQMLQLERELEGLAKLVLDKIPPEMTKFRGERFYRVSDMKQFLSTLTEHCGDKYAAASDKFKEPEDYGFKDNEDAYRKMLLLKKAWKGIVDVTIDRNGAYVEARYKLVKK